MEVENATAGWVFFKFFFKHKEKLLLMDRQRIPK
jgi:hypothetical protein